MTNTLAYYATESITAVKSFMTQAPAVAAAAVAAAAVAEAAAAADFVFDRKWHSRACIRPNDSFLPKMIDT